MLFQATNIIPDVRTGIGLGTVDVTQDLEISWQVTGDYPVLTGYSIQFYQNDAVSTLIGSPIAATLATPFYGTDALGNPQIFTVTIPVASIPAGITNGNEYKYVITQYYSGGSVTQSSASVFITRSAPTLTVNPIGTGGEIDSSEYTFGITYSQAQQDTLDWIRYRIGEIDGGDTTELYDSGNIYCPTVLSCTYDGFSPRNPSTGNAISYYIRVTAQTSNGVLADTGNVSFSANYNIGSVSGSGWAAQVIKSTGAVSVNGDEAIYLESPDWVKLYRFGGSTGASMFPVTAKLPYSGEGLQILDYGVCSTRGDYTYAVMMHYTESLPGEPDYDYFMVSGKGTPIFATWFLYVCEENPNGGYTVQNVYTFRNNLESGSVSNNNTPYVAQNFTATPTVQLAPQNYRSGSLTALVGSVSAGAYSDTYALRAALTALSTSQQPMFLKSSKGDLMQIRISGPVTFSIQEGTKSLAQTVTVPWVEIANADDVSITSVIYES